LLTLCAGLFFISAPLAYAYYNEESHGCEYLNIQIVNQTPYTCVLKETNTVNGNRLSPVPPSINSGGYANILMRQFWFHNEIRTTYECGGKTIKLTSFQSRCDYFAGRVSAEIAYKDPGIDANFSKEDSSKFWDTRGMLSWFITTSE